MTQKNQNNDHTEQDEEFAALFKKAKKIDDEHSIDIDDPETEAAFRQVAQKTNLYGENDSHRSLRKLAVAAIVIIGAIGIAYILTPCWVRAPKGKPRIVTLSDGTTVTLRSGSQLTYRRWFGYWGRTVLLSGEAFFQVTHTGTPFHVRAGRGRITVMGTKFDVRSWWNNKQHKTSVFLKQGQVKFSSSGHKKQAVILKPGEYSFISDQQPTPAHPQKKKALKALSWLQKGLSFTDQPLSVIFNKISGRFNVKIQTKPNSLKQEKLTIYLSNLKSAEQTIADICRAKNLQYSKKGNKFIITKSY